MSENSISHRNGKDGKPSLYEPADRRKTDEEVAGAEEDEVEAEEAAVALRGDLSTAKTLGKSLYARKAEFYEFF